MRILQSLDHELLRALHSADSNALHAAESALREIVVDLARQGATLDGVISVLRDSCRALAAGDHSEWVRERAHWLENRGRVIAVQELSCYFEDFRTPPYGTVAMRRKEGATRPVAGR